MRNNKSSLSGLMDEISKQSGHNLSFPVLSSTQSSPHATIDCMHTSPRSTVSVWQILSLLDGAN